MRKLSQKIVDRAELLYKRGHSLAKIAERLNVTDRALRKYKKNGAWDNDKLPVFTLNDLAEDTRILLFTYMQGVLQGREEDFSRTCLNIKNLVNALKELEDLAPDVSAKNSVLTMQHYMAWVIDNSQSEHKEDILQAAQQYHDINQHALQD